MVAVIDWIIHGFQVLRAELGETLHPVSDYIQTLRDTFQAIRASMAWGFSLTEAVNLVAMLPPYDEPRLGKIERRLRGGEHRE